MFECLSNDKLSTTQQMINDGLAAVLLLTAAAENLPNPRATTLGDDTAKVHGTNLLNSYATTLPCITNGISQFLIITGGSILT